MTSLPSTSMEFVNDSVRILRSDADYAAVELFKGYPDWLLRFAYVCCIICMVIGIPGNIITIAALAKYKRVRNATAIFIMNLSCSDLLFCCMTIPLAASTFWNRAWTHGKILCQLYPPARYLLSVVSIFSIMAITINRYILIVHPRLYRKIYQNRNIIIMLASLWIAPLIILLPTCFGKWGRFDLDQKNGSCSIVPDQNNRSSKKILFILAFGLPCFVIFYCYARIYFIVKKATKKAENSKLKKNPITSSTEGSTTADSSSITVRVTAALSSDNGEETGNDTNLKVFYNLKSERATTSTVITADKTSDNTSSDEEIVEPRRPQKTVLKKSIAFLKISLPTRKDKRLGTMILAVMTAFSLCHLPIVLIKVLRWFTPHPVVNIVAHILLYISSCINPVIYVVMSNEYKKAYRYLFKRRSKRRLLLHN